MIRKCWKCKREFASRFDWHIYCGVCVKKVHIFDYCAHYNPAITENRHLVHINCTSKKCYSEYYSMYFKSKYDVRPLKDIALDYLLNYRLPVTSEEKRIVEYTESFEMSPYVTVVKSECDKYVKKV